jgi:putative ABC transport system ATP-binding protein
MSTSPISQTLLDNADHRLIYKLEGVSKIFTKGSESVHALASVDLEIPTGSLVSIQGPTGGGKSTLLQVLGGLDLPTSGTVQLLGRDISRLGDRHLAGIRAEAIGFVFQHFNLIPTLSAVENVQMALVPLGVTKDESMRRSLEALDQVGLADRATHLPSELSGGQQQRVAIARALVKDPQIILADEPTGNLDERTRDDIIELLESLWREKGMTIIIVTHDSNIASHAQIRLFIENGHVAIRQ